MQWESRLYELCLEHHNNYYSSYLLWRSDCSKWKTGTAFTVFCPSACFREYAVFFSYYEYTSQLWL